MQLSTKNTGFKNNDFEKNQTNIKKMQTEAIKQAHEIHSRSKLLNLNQKENLNFFQNKKHPRIPNLTKVKFKKSVSRKFKIPNFSNLIDILFQDQDKTLIITLIIILMDNEENMGLIIVLFYLLI